MIKTALFCANGFEECEGLVVVDLLKRAGIDIKIVSLQNDLSVLSSHQIKIQCDLMFDEVNFDELDMIILPGGMPGTLRLKEHVKLCEKIKEFHQNRKPLAAICAAPSVLGGLGLLKGRTVTCYPGFENECLEAICSGEKVEKDDHIITARGLGCAIEFAAKIIETLLNEETAKSVLSEIQF